MKHHLASAPVTTTYIEEGFIAILIAVQTKLVIEIYDFLVCSINNTRLCKDIAEVGLGHCFRAVNGKKAQVAS
jgi:hypothetical protein